MTVGELQKELKKYHPEQEIRFGLFSFKVLPLDVCRCNRSDFLGEMPIVINGECIDCDLPVIPNSPGVKNG